MKFIFKLFGFFVIVIILGSLAVNAFLQPILEQVRQNYSQESDNTPTNLSPENLFKKTENYAIYRSDKTGNPSNTGEQFVFAFNPSAKNFNYQVGFGFNFQNYLTNPQNVTFTAKTFRQIVEEKTAENESKLLFAINADYIDELNRPQGLNVSQGQELIGDFANLRSSFGIGNFENDKRTATIQVGKRQDPNLNHTVVTGNGRFFSDGQFKDICPDLGQNACAVSTNRSLVAVTEDNWVIMAVHQTNSDPLLPVQFEQFLTGAADYLMLGKITDGMLFDGGASPGMYFDGQFLLENLGPIGSVFLIYEE